MRPLIEGGSYSKAVTINFSTVQMRLLTEGGSFSRAATINFSAVQLRLLIEGTSWFSGQGMVSMRVRRQVYGLSVNLSTRANYHFLHHG